MFPENCPICNSLLIRNDVGSYADGSEYDVSSFSYLDTGIQRRDISFCLSLFAYYVICIGNNSLGYS